MNKFYKISYILTTIFSTVVISLGFFFYFIERPYYENDVDVNAIILNSTDVVIPDKAKIEIIYLEENNSERSYIYTILTFKKEPVSFLENYNFSYRKLTSGERSTYLQMLSYHNINPIYLWDIEQDYEILIVNDCYFLYSRSLKKLVFNGYKLGG